VWIDTTDGRTFWSNSWMSNFEPPMVAAGRAGVLTVAARGELEVRFHSAAAVTPPATMAPTRPPIRAARMPAPRPDGEPPEGRGAPDPAGGPGGGLPPDPRGPAAVHGLPLVGGGWPNEG